MKSIKHSSISFFLLVTALFTLTACGPAQTPLPEPTPSSTSEISPTQTASPSPSPTPSPSQTPTKTPTPVPAFSFVVTSDMSFLNSPEYVDYPNFFKALLDYVAAFGPGDFMVSPGDITLGADTRWSIDQVLGADYLWFPMVGNHDFGSADMTFIEQYTYDPNGDLEPNIVSWGPEACGKTNYSFDFKNAHFVALNVYCNEEAAWGIDGSITDSVYEWLAADLEATQKKHIFVFGHEPAFPQPDAKTGDLRHLYESLDQYPSARDRFWELLQTHQVVAYIHGHTHTYSAIKIDGIWQLDAGHSMGTRAAPSPGTFLIISVQGETVSLKTYRGEDGPGFAYLLWEEITLRP